METRNQNVGEAPIAPSVELLESRTLLSTYYVSSGGNDGAAGTSTGAAWRTIARVNAASLKPGDRVLFAGGQTFSGGINLKNGGSSSSPIVIGSYGSGHAIIKSGTRDGAYLLNKGGVWFQNLTFVGSPNGWQHDGIHFEIVSGRMSNIRVENCTISGYGGNGVFVMGDRSGAGFSDVRITGNTVHDNVNTGIATFALSHNAISGVYIANNDVYDNYGDGKSTCTGSGIMLGGLNGAVVEHNVAHHNGYKGGNGNLGIWAYDSNNVILQYNESYGQHSFRGQDGGGFDFDADTSNSIMQYNYSHDNDGNGFQLNQWRNNSLFTGDIVRYNVSQNDARKNNYAGLEAWGKVLNSTFYNNVSFVSPSKAGGNPSGIKVHNASVGGLYVSGLHFANNIVITTGGRPLVLVSSAELGGAKDLRFVGNDYWSSGSAANFNFGRTYTSLSAWQSATGQEKLNGKSVGLQVDPKLTAAGTGGVLNGNLAQLSAYRLQSTSPLINKGVNVATVFGVAGVSKDFFGDPIAAGAASEIGVDQV
ncbi:MAG TPA: right-handed parallel beta-helix repeat-containing protein [Tepidisphaeraceae bacterium]|nr:right-handed parallel beta-helix repeat-containing protein [Tepidisphaeraceae bacterium]